MPRHRLFILLLLLMIILLGLPLVAFRARGAEPTGPEEEGLVGRGGPISAILFFDLGDLNALLFTKGYAPLPAALFLMGGGGFGGLIEGLRFGGLGFGGAVIGGGDARLTLRDRRPSSFVDAISDPPNASFTRGFFAVQAHLGVELFVLDWLMLKVNLGYLWGFSEPWKLGQAELPGPPESLSAPLVQVLVSFGGRSKLEEETESELESERKGKGEGKAETLERGRFAIEQLETELS